jgi:Domain of unknown function (DUF4382)
MSLMTVDRARLPRRLLWTACALALGLATLAGCHPSSLVTYGTGVVTMHDASEDRDFVSYIVNVDTITLTRTDGVVVEPFATPEIVDLAKLHDLTELVENPAIPIGTYTSLELVLDYTSPDITVNVNGVVTLASPIDTTGAPMLTSTLTVNFDPNNPLVINANECTRLAIDFNLAAANTVNFSASPLTVTVQPFVAATPAALDTTVMRARGLLVVTQPDSHDYIINMRPFQDLISALGALTVNTSASTYFNINGVTYTGAAGLTAMQGLQVSTAVAAYGTLDSFATITPSFNATAVYAGTSLESPLADYITGMVSAVSGDTLTIHGANWLSSLGVLQSYAELPVTVSSATIVSEDGVAASGLSPRSISVGQLINVSGVSTLNSSSVVTALDASIGQVRLQSTPIWGTLNSGAAGSMSLDLTAIGDYPPAVFSFAGTGSSAANDAVATAYLVDTGTLDESGTAAGTLLQANGIIAPFGAAPPDFAATAVTAAAAMPQQLVVEWDSGGTTAPFTSASSAGLVVNLANANLSSTIRYISTGPVNTDLTTLPASPTIVFATGVPLELVIGNNTVSSVFNSVAGFATALASTLNGTNEVYRLVCVGQYSTTSNTFTATQVTLNLQQ